MLELFAFNGDLQLSVALASDHILVGEDAFEYYINLRSTQENPDSILLCPEENTAESYLPGRTWFVSPVLRRHGEAPVFLCR